MFAHAQIPYRPSVRLSVHGSVHPCVRAGCENVHISIPIHLCLSPKGGARASVHTCACMHTR